LTSVLLEAQVALGAAVGAGVAEVDAGGQTDAVYSWNWVADGWIELDVAFNAVALLGVATVVLLPGDDRSSSVKVLF